MRARLSSLRSHRALIAGLILPTLLFRAAIPAGFMPVFDAQGGFGIGLCPGVTASGAMHAVHAHHAGGGGSAAASHGEICPFALSAGPALAHAFVAQSATGAPATQVATDRHSSLVIASIERAQSARGPPNPLGI